MEPASVGSDGRIYIVNRSGDFYCLAPDHSVIWQVHFNGDPRGGFSIGPDGSLYVGVEGGVSGLFIVRQQAVAVSIDQIQMDRGSVVSGGLPEIQTSDDQYLLMRNGATALRTEPPIRVLLSGSSAYTFLAKLSVKLAHSLGVLQPRSRPKRRQVSEGGTHLLSEPDDQRAPPSASYRHFARRLLFGVRYCPFTLSGSVAVGKGACYELARLRAGIRALRGR